MSAVIKLSLPERRGFWEIPILFADEHVVALDKPAGLLTSPEPAAADKPSLMELLHAAIAAGKPWVLAGGFTYLMNAHRLDAETSGVLLLARSKPTFTTLADLFGETKPRLTCLALVQGSPREDRFEIGAKLSPDQANPELTVVDPKQGKRAQTVFEVAERFGRFTLLKCQPLTHRPHQVRAHLRNAGLPIAGDTLYGGQPLLLSRLKPGFRLKAGHVERPLLGQAVLHAESLTLEHPVTHAALTITAPWPKELKVALNYLRRYGAA